MSIFKLSFLFLSLITTEAQQTVFGPGGGGGGNGGGGGGGPNRPNRPNRPNPVPPVGAPVIDPRPPTPVGAPVIDPRPPTNPGPPGTPNCGMVPTTQFSGIASFVDTDGSGFLPTAGDLSIAVSLLPLNPSPGSSVSIKAICILTAEDPSTSAPFCTFESTIEIQAGPIVLSGTTISIGTPPMLAITGGTGDLFGAYGELITGADLSFEPVGPGLIQLSFTASVNYCVPPSVGDFF